MRRRDRGLATLLSLASAALLAGVLVPIVEIEKPLADDVFSVLTGIAALFDGGLAPLGVLVLAFSILFPAAKLALLWDAWADPKRASGPRLAWVAWLGKWSMLDVYVVAILFGAIRLGVIADVEPRFGVYVFAGSVLATMIASHVVRRGRRAPETASENAPAATATATATARAVSAAALGSFLAGVALPLMVVEKWIFWENDYSLLESLAAMADEGEHALAALIALFALALPLLRLAALLALRARKGASPALVRGVLLLDEWAMADVFTLALLVVVIKAGTMATVSPRAGLWLLVASALLSAWDRRQLRRGLGRALR